MALAPKQRSFRGLTFGAGTDIRLISEEGLEETTLRIGDREVPRGDGDFPGLHNRDSKEPVLELLVRGDDVPATVRQVLAAWAADGEPVQAQYVFRNFEDQVYFVRARPGRSSIRRDAVTGVGNHMPILASIVVSDPNIYAVEVKSEQVPIFSTESGGAALPSALPFGMTASTQELGAATNDGDRNAPTSVQFQFPAGGSGTCNGVLLENLDTGVSLDIDAVLSPGQTLTATTGAQNPFRPTSDDPWVHIAGVSRYGVWQNPKEDFVLAKGSNSLRFEVDGTSTDIVCVVRWHDTF